VTIWVFAEEVNMMDFIAYWGGFVFGLSLIASLLFLLGLFVVRPLVERYCIRKEIKKFNMRAEDFFDVYE
jgi:Flp pilus assembly protein TadB